MCSVPVCIFSRETYVTTPQHLVAININSTLLVQGCWISNWHLVAITFSVWHHLNQHISFLLHLKQLKAIAEDFLSMFQEYCTEAARTSWIPHHISTLQQPCGWCLTMSLEAAKTLGLRTSTTARLLVILHLMVIRGLHWMVLTMVSFKKMDMNLSKCFLSKGHTCVQACDKEEWATPDDFDHRKNSKVFPSAHVFIDMLFSCVYSLIPLQETG